VAAAAATPAVVVRRWLLAAAAATPAVVVRRWSLAAAAVVVMSPLPG
jgi:hypothetical protein